MPDSVEETLIVVACDNNYAPYAATVLLSAARHLQSDTKASLVVCTFGLSETACKLFKRVQELTGRPVRIEVFEEQYLQFPSGRYTNSMYLRFEVADRFCNAKRMLYLDCDVVVLQPLESLLFDPLQGMAVGAVQDYADLCGGSFLDHKRNLGLPEKHAYFNSGVLLVDLERWRQDRCRDGLIEVLERIKSFTMFPDQDALNILFEENARILDPKWNVQMATILTKTYYPDWQPDLEKTLKAPAIVHFTTDNKPWRSKQYLPYGNKFQNLLAQAAGIPEDSVFKKWQKRSLFQLIVTATRVRAMIAAAYRKLNSSS